MKPYTFERIDVEFSGGQDVSQKARSYAQTQFGLGTTSPADTAILLGSPGSVFTNDKILDPANGFGLNVGGIGTESYLAAQTTDAAYVKADALINDKWRLAGGVRWEDFHQAALPIDTLQSSVDVGQCALVPCDAAALEQIVFAEDDLYPSVAATRILRDVWAEDFQIRVGLSQTVARPDLREISASSYIEAPSGRPTAIGTGRRLDSAAALPNQSGLRSGRHVRSLPRCAMHFATSTAHPR
jgi:outer membrane receptor protein involved in Fe transport